MAVPLSVGQVARSITRLPLSVSIIPLEGSCANIADLHVARHAASVHPTIKLLIKCYLEESSILPKSC